MYSIAQNIKNENTKIKRYLPHDLQTKKHAVEMYLNSGDIEYTCRKYHISKYSLWRWLKKYDGTENSLEDKSHKPKRRQINEFIRSNSNVRKHMEVQRALNLKNEQENFQKDVNYVKSL